MTVDGAWEGDRESKPCEMGGGPVVNYDDDPAFKAQTLRGGNERGGKTHDQATHIALRLAAGTKHLYMCSSANAAHAMTKRVEEVLSAAGLDPEKYMKKFSVHVTKRTK